MTLIKPRPAKNLLQKLASMQVHLLLRKRKIHFLQIKNKFSH